jgi:hypothetical protein
VTLCVFARRYYHSKEDFDAGQPPASVVQLDKRVTLHRLSPSSSAVFQINTPLRPFVFTAISEAEVRNFIVVAVVVSSSWLSLVLAATVRQLGQSDCGRALLRVSAEHDANSGTNQRLGTQGPPWVFPQALVPAHWQVCDCLVDVQHFVKTQLLFRTLYYSAFEAGQPLGALFLVGAEVACANADEESDDEGVANAGPDKYSLSIAATQGLTKITTTS